MSLVVLIPALNPSDQLIMVVKNLATHPSVSKIIVVNDGSDASFNDIFQQAAALPIVELLQHATNLGKGAALRTGINHFLCHAPIHAILVTADADGQHLPEDIVAVALYAQDNSRALVLGTRAFGGDVPCRSKFGNNMTRYIFRALIGKKIGDTQTGLRAIPRSIMPQLLKIKACGYAFELEMLILAARNGVSIQTLPIQTVYLHGNQSSHFKPVMDSVRIYLVFVRFIAPFLLALILDLALFALIWSNTHRFFLSMVTARLTASSINYILNTRLISHSPSSWRRSLIQYGIYVTLLGGAAILLIDALVHRMGWNVYFAKVFIETLLFMVSYGIQRNIGFASSSDKAPIAPSPEPVPAKL